MIIIIVEAAQNKAQTTNNNLDKAPLYNRLPMSNDLIATQHFYLATQSHF